MLYFITCLSYVTKMGRFKFAGESESEGSLYAFQGEHIWDNFLNEYCLCCGTEIWPA